MQRNILAGVVVVLLLLLGGQTTSHHRRRTSAASSRGIQARKPSTRFSSLGDGLWMPPSHSNWTLEDIETRWGMGIAGNVANDVDRRRLEVASSYSWRPEGNLAGFDSWRFVREMHNSQNGLIILGDSVSKQTWEVLRAMLRLPSGEYEGAGGFVERTLGDLSYPALFATDSTIALLRHALPDVPLERFSLPFVTYKRDDILVREEELKTYWGRGDKRSKFVFKEWLKSSPWEAELPKTKKRGLWKGERNSIVLLSTGSHWSSADLGQNEAGLLQLARQTARGLLARLHSVPSLDIIYRSTSPPHRACAASSTPVFPALPFSDHENFPEWSWSTFGKQNDVWAEEMDRLPPRKEGQFVFLNITEMSGQRPDAHTGRGDCLHWALPGVIGWWVEIIWTVILDS